MDSHEAIGAANSILNPLLAGTSESELYIWANIGADPSRPLAYGPGPYASQGFHIPLSLVPIPSPNFSFADGENASTIVSNAARRPRPTSRPTNSGRGTDRPSGSPPIVRSNLPTPFENPETLGGNIDPAPTQPDLNTFEEDSEEDSGFGSARWSSVEVRLLIKAKKLEYAQLDNSGSREVIFKATTKWNRIEDHL
ncbi:hypothetical protein R1flu_007473 [Riccia fluitans]|uniref:Uncharacterized protein n=1 Tax=Riccia fluitans TaxID=41844 RepID=A0ABD1Z1N0_9MARC